MKTDSISSFFSRLQSASVKSCPATVVALGLSIGTASAATQIVAAENFYGGVAATVTGEGATVTMNTNIEKLIEQNPKDEANA